MGDDDHRPRGDSPKRDPRADPDDEAPSSSRVDVVNVERTEGLATAANTLRRDLARLQQQAAVVERTIEDHRKQQSDALERLERATEHALELQSRLQQSQADVESWRRQHENALAELQTVRGERDDLERAIEAAKAAALDIGRLREEADRLKEERDEARKNAEEATSKIASLVTDLSTLEDKEKASSAEAQALAAELAKEKEGGAKAMALAAELKEAKAKATKLAADLATMREKLDRAGSELQQANQAAAQGKMESLRAREDANEAREAASRLRDEAERERAAARDEIATLERRHDEVLAITQSDLEAARSELDHTRADVTRATRDLDTTRVERDVLMERATMLEGDLADARGEADRARRELDLTKTELQRLEARVMVAERARAVVEDSIRQLRSEISAAFGRVRAIAPSHPPPPMPQTKTTSFLPRERSKAPEEAPTITGAPKATSFPPVTAEAPPLSIPPMPPMPKTGVSVDDAERTGATGAHGGVGGRKPPNKGDEEERPNLGLDEGWPSPSQPPPAPTRPPPSTPSARPHAPSVRPNAPSARPNAPSVRPNAVSLKPPTGSIPPVYYPSVPPAVAISASDDVVVDSASPAPAEIFELLFDPDTARDAIEVLRANPEWIRGAPPPELVAALNQVDYDAEGPLFEAARLWEREPLCRALVAALKREHEPRLREHGAWLLKHLGAPSAWRAIAELAMSEKEPLMVRRWLLEALDRLAAGRLIGWRELGDTVVAIAKHPDASLRDGAVGVLMSLEKSEEKQRVLLDILRDDDDEVVLASAVHALASVLPVELNPNVVDRLLGHSSARVQRSVKDLIERSRSDVKITDGSAAR